MTNGTEPNRPTPESGSTLERLRSAVLSTEQIRRVDQLAIAEYGMNSLVLMENAAYGCVQWLRGKFPQPPQTVILCGSGNNGGDGLAIARHLGTLGWNCQSFVLGPIEKLSPDCRANFEILRKGEHATPPQVLQRHGRRETEANFSEYAAETQGLPHVTPEALTRVLHEAELIIDAMLGTGSRGAPRSPFDGWIEDSNSSAAQRVAIDLPTGIDGETCVQPGVAFRPHATLTFVARKPAMAMDTVGFDTQSVFGEISVLPIGTPSSLNQRVLAWLDHEAKPKAL
ncbi:MAG: NAD(P)H-hydrate epimerase [Pirellulaceae bacterium]